MNVGCSGQMCVIQSLRLSQPELYAVHQSSCISKYKLAVPVIWRIVESVNSSFLLICAQFRLVML